MNPLQSLEAPQQQVDGPNRGKVMPTAEAVDGSADGPMVFGDVVAAERVPAETPPPRLLLTDLPATVPDAPTLAVNDVAVKGTSDTVNVNEVEQQPNGPLSIAKASEGPITNVDPANAEKQAPRGATIVAEEGRAKLRPSTPGQELPLRPNGQADAEVSIQQEKKSVTPAQSLLEGRIKQENLPRPGQDNRSPVAIENAADIRAEKTPPAGREAGLNAIKSALQPALFAGAADKPLPRAKDGTERAVNAPSRAELQVAMTSAAPSLAMKPPMVAATAVQTTMVPAQTKELVMPIAVEEQSLTGLSPTSDRVVTVLGSGATAPLSNPEMARQVAQQIAIAATNGNSKTTEIALNPEELGRVRMTLSAVDGGLTLVVNAERPETQELMRRHIDLLAQEFRSLGYDNLAFSFTSDGDKGAQNHEGHSFTEDTADHVPHSERADAASLIKSSGLDLRL